MRDGYGQKFAQASFLPTPLCPAGHLPHLGGDWRFLRRRSLFNVADWRKQSQQAISPLAGEMSGRTEGGDVERRLRDMCFVGVA
ncbi:hypothetical protein EJ066_06470 [Mesorhizobium sp. M9A.F.Ca.ET.002.03.1.2]|nr:hypothetical protein EJ066_06470 [Mesorhizobium sp. M9A.F.Ca.ET.002.03.1.2]